MAEFMLTAKRRKLTLHQATTWDMEWNGESEHKLLAERKSLETQGDS